MSIPYDRSDRIFFKAASMSASSRLYLSTSIFKSFPRLLILINSSFNILISASSDFACSTYKVSRSSISFATIFFTSQRCFHIKNGRKIVNLYFRSHNCSPSRAFNSLPITFAFSKCKTNLFRSFGIIPFNKCSLNAVPSQYLSILERVRVFITFLLMFLV